MKGGNAMDYKVVEKQSFKVLEKVETHRIVNEKTSTQFPIFGREVIRMVQSELCLN